MRTLLLIGLLFFTTLGGFCLAQHKEAERLTHNKEAITIRKLTALCSPFRETNLAITPDGGELFFMSARGEKPWSRRVRGSSPNEVRYDGDLWQSRKGSTGWSSPANLGAKINTEKNEDEPSISIDAQRITYQSWRTGWQHDGGPYYSAQKKNGRWATSEGLGTGITAFFREKFHANFGYATDGMCLSPDGKTFWVAAGADYYKKMNIYFSKKNKDGTWSYLEKHPLSTNGNERSVFLPADGGRTVYFASDRYSNGFGGLDILKAELNEAGEVVKVYNLGEPFNTPQDDYGFILSSDGKTAYFVRDGDIYEASLAEANPSIRPEPVYFLQGAIKTPTGKAVSEVRVTLKQGAQELQQTQTDMQGNYRLAFPAKPGTYELLLAKEKFEKQVEVKFEEKKVTQKKEDVVWENSPFSPPPPMPKEALHIYFGFDSALVDAQEAKKIRTFCKENCAEGKVIHISGFTDTKGSATYNLALSRRRAEAVRAVLLHCGCPKELLRMHVKGEDHKRLTPEEQRRVSLWVGEE